MPAHRAGQGWESGELLYQHFWNENNSGMHHITHREQQQKTYLRFLTEKGDLFINNSWVPIEHARKKQCYSIENTVICHCFIWHLHFFFFFFAWYCKTFLDGMQNLYKWKKSQCGDSLFLLWWVHSQLHTCVFMQVCGTFSHIHKPPSKLVRNPTEKTEISIPNGLVEGSCE